jgi:organic hydroperoxide reductase OsmC/OhrA
VGPVTVTADVTLTAGASGFDLSVVLKTKVEGVDHATAEKLAHKAHTEICPYSKATRGNIDVTIEIL